MDKKALEFLVEASKVLNSTLDVHTLVSLVYDLITSAVDCQTCSLGRLGEKGDRIEVLLAFGKTGRDVSGLTVERTNGIMGAAVRTGKPILLNDRDEIAAYSDAIDRNFKISKTWRSLPIRSCR